MSIHKISEGFVHNDGSSKKEVSFKSILDVVEKSKNKKEIQTLYFGGIADLVEDFIEKSHQIGKKLDKITCQMNGQKLCDKERWSNYEGSGSVQETSPYRINSNE